MVQRVTYLAAYSKAHVKIYAADRSKHSRAPMVRQYSLQSSAAIGATPSRTTRGGGRTFFSSKGLSTRKRSDKDDDQGVIYHLPSRASRNSSLDLAPQGPMRLEHLGRRDQRSKGFLLLMSWSTQQGRSGGREVCTR